MCAARGDHPAKNTPTPAPRGGEGPEVNEMAKSDGWEDITGGGGQFRGRLGNAVRVMKDGRIYVPPTLHAFEALKGQKVRVMRKLQNGKVVAIRILIAKDGATFSMPKSSKGGYISVPKGALPQHAKYEFKEFDAKNKVWTLVLAEE